MAQTNPNEAPEISIHALVKRATSWGSQFLNAFLISIHALVKRATEDVRWSEVDELFQSTPS